MGGLFDQLVYWHWFVLAIILLILEMLTPGAFFMWMGVAAGITGLLLLGTPELDWHTQLIIFSVLSLVAIAAARVWFRRNPIDSDQPDLNERSHELLGRVFVVEQPIKNGEGRIKVGESTWKAVGPDCKVGTRVRVVGVDGAVLRVEKAVT